MKQFLTEMKKYVGFTNEDEQLLKEIAPVMKPYIPELVDIFYAEIKRHEGTMKVITGGDEQINRLKGTLTTWLEEFFSRDYDEQFAKERFNIGYKHVDIDLDQKFMISAMGLIERNLIKTATDEFSDDKEKLTKIIKAIDRACNLNLNLMCETYTHALHEKLNKKQKDDLRDFLKISGIGKPLYEKMAQGYKKRNKE